MPYKALVLSCQELQSVEGMRSRRQQYLYRFRTQSSYFSSISSFELDVGEHYLVDLGEAKGFSFFNDYGEYKHRISVQLLSADYIECYEFDTFIATRHLLNCLYEIIEFQKSQKGRITRRFLSQYKLLEKALYKGNRKIELYTMFGAMTPLEILKFNDSII